MPLDRLPDVRLSPFSPQQEQQLPATYSAAFGYMFLTSERRARRLVVDLLAKEVQLRVAIKPFVHQQKAYSPGTILIRKNENAPVMETMLFKLAADHQVALIPVGTALSDKGPDLGGNRFKLLQKPRVALIGGTNVSGYTFGAAWHSLDQFFGLKHTLLANYNLHQADLRKYNVIILPELWGNHNDWSAYLNKKYAGQTQNLGATGWYTYRYWQWGGFPGRYHPKICQYEVAQPGAQRTAQIYPDATGGSIRSR
jgi:hypothetical protein